MATAILESNFPFIYDHVHAKKRLFLRSLSTSAPYLARLEGDMRLRKALITGISDS